MHWTSSSSVATGGNRWDTVASLVGANTRMNITSVDDVPSCVSLSLAPLHTGLIGTEWNRNTVRVTLFISCSVWRTNTDHRQLERERERIEKTLSLSSGRRRPGSSFKSRENIIRDQKFLSFSITWFTWRLWRTFLSSKSTDSLLSAQCSSEELRFPRCPLPLVLRCAHASVYSNFSLSFIKTGIGTDSSVLFTLIVHIVRVRWLSINDIWLNSASSRSLSNDTTGLMNG